MLDRGLRDNRADQIVGQDVRPDLLIHRLGRFAAKVVQGPHISLLWRHRESRFLPVRWQRPGRSQLAPSTMERVSSGRRSAGRSFDGQLDEHLDAPTARR